MSFRSRAGLLCCAALATCAVNSAAAADRVLRVCSDPNNLPFSNQAQEGFENRLAEILARDLKATVQYSWWSERKSFTTNSLDQHHCDILMGIPTPVDTVLTTEPYYQSTYVFVSRHDRHLGVQALSDSRLSDWRIGIHVVGDGYAPPASALARRGLSGNLVGFSLFGPEGEMHPASNLIAAVARGDVDIALAWGPLAGYFAAEQKPALDVVPVSPSMFMAVPFTYDVSMGVRIGNASLRAELQDALSRECVAVQSLLDRYHVPQVREGKPRCKSSQQRSSLSR